mgnify:CR=1 FL=1
MSDGVKLICNEMVIQALYARKNIFELEGYEKLLEKSIAIRFMGNYIRITAGTNEENIAVVKALDEILDNMTKGE